MKKIIALIGCLALANAAWAANLGYDDASDPAYGLGWTNGSNGGTGFGAWELSTIIGSGQAGHFIGDSTQNADQADDGTVNGTASDGDINTGAFRPAAWGMYAEVDSTARALRSFTGGPLAAAQTFSINFDNGYILNDGFVALGLYDSATNFIFGVFFLGGQSNYAYFDGGGPNTLSLGYGDEGLNLSVTMTSATNYQAVLTRLDSSSVSWSGTLAAQPEGFFAEAVNVGGTSPRDFFINSMEIVPEPSTIALGALGVFGVVLRALRRRAR